MKRWRPAISEVAAKRSLLDHKTWICIVPETDQSWFLQAGPLLKVKRLLEENFVEPGATNSRWKKLSDDEYELWELIDE